MTCSVEGCERRHLARMLCSMHYHRWERHGDPLGGGVFRGDGLNFFEETVLTYQNDDCLIWPFHRDAYGYGKVTKDGRLHSVHRLLCEIINGPPPGPKDEAAHNCGNGAMGCCNPKHVRWDSRTGNQFDRIEHGTSNRGSNHGLSKLDEDSVKQILALRGSKSQSKIAAQFGVSQPAINAIFTKRNWGWITNDDDPELAKRIA